MSACFAREQKLILEAFQHYKKDILLVYEVFKYITRRDPNVDASYKLIEEIILKCKPHNRFFCFSSMPIVFIKNFEQRLRDSGYYKEWLIDRKRIDSACYEAYVIYPHGILSENRIRKQSIFIKFYDNTNITWKSFLSYFYSALQYLDRDFMADLEFLGYLMRFEGFNFERAWILMMHLPAIDAESISIDVHYVEDGLRRLGVYHLYEIENKCYDWEGSVPGVQLKRE